MSLLSRLAVQAARAYGILSSRSTNISADYLVVAGGASGGVIGGGGAGGYRTSTATLSTLNTYSIIVGAGGAGTTSQQGNNGSDSSLSGTGLTTITSTGGGGGAGESSTSVNSGKNGGSGGGAATSWNGSSSVIGTAGNGNTPSTSPSQGNNGGAATSATATSSNGGGGGGAGAVGGNATGASSSGSGGAGSSSSISGSSVTYAGGGGAGAYIFGGTGTAGTGGSGGGGNGGRNGLTSTSGTTNTGGGGGGRGIDSSGNSVGSGSGSGGSGIVIISYTSATPKFVGGTITTSGGKQIHTFTSSGTLSPLTEVPASYLVVAGGGGGGNAIGGGGGAGGLLTGSTTLYSPATYIVTVGAGGSGGTNASSPVSGSTGSSSILSGTGITTVTSTGGGGGGAGSTVAGLSGGSGGGGSGINGAGGSGTSGQGYAGGAGSSGSGNYGAGGGGGSSAVGGTGNSTTAGSGGAGTASSISGSSVTYAGGGGGGTFSAGTAGTGGSGGGGAGSNTTALAVSGTTNLGGGGGGGFQSSGGTNYNGGAGGSGVVIISYAGSQKFNGGTVTTSGGNTIHTFYATGALTPITNNLTNSLRFRRSNSAYLSRTPTVAGNQKTWTYSAWVKRGLLGSIQDIWHANGPSTTENDYFAFDSDTLQFRIKNSNVVVCELITTQVFRDPSAWYHIVVAWDTTQATAANRVKLYVNGNQITAFSTATYPSQNTNTNSYNNTVLHTIGTQWYNSTLSNYLDGYMTDINFIDGQALEPYYFGSNDSNNVWKPIKYYGTYGTNGFYLTFGNTTSTTTLGYDSSPNGNNWTTNNISLTAGVTYDAMTDVPTLTSATAANYAVLNPVFGSTNITFSEANLKAQVGSTGSVYRTASGTFAVSSGKWYWELVFGNPTTGNPLAGIGDITVALSSWNADTSTNANFWYLDASSGNKINGSGGPGTAYGSSFTTSDICMVALDMDNGKIWWGKNGTWFASGDPAAGTNAAYTTLANKLLTVALMGGCGSCGFSGNIYQLNFGQRPFSYTPPTGFVALNTYNLPTPTIIQGNRYMDATTYTGTGASQSITNASGFKPDLVWCKGRSASGSWNALFDSIRGATKGLSSNATDSEYTSTAGNDLASFNSNGFSVGPVQNWGSTNQASATLVGWQWQAGQGTNTTNTAGSITSTVSVNATAGFSIVTYTGNGSNGATIGHGLGVAPRWVIVKRRNSSGDDWLHYHISLGATQSIAFDTAAAITSSTRWNNTAPSSSVITLGTSTGVNANGGTYVAYCWAAIPGYSAFGSYTGNGSSDGVFVYTGFRPAFVLFKNASASFSWMIKDNKRANPYNVTDGNLYPDLSAAEDTGSTANIDLLSNGFKMRGTSSLSNGNGNTIIYMAFAENPTKYCNAR